MGEKANQGASVVVWSILLTVAILLVLGGVLWWWDGYILHA